jgi:hypothetical protein
LSDCCKIRRNCSTEFCPVLWSGVFESAVISLWSLHNYVSPQIVSFSSPVSSKFTPFYVIFAQISRKVPFSRLLLKKITLF